MSYGSNDRDLRLLWRNLVEREWNEYFNGKRKKIEVEKEHYNEWFGGYVGVVEETKGMKG